MSDFGPLVERWRDMQPHVETLTALAAEATTLVELGVRGAVSTWALLNGLPANGTMVSVDIDGTVVDTLPERVRNDPRWRIVIGDDLDADLPPADLVFIDTSHEYHHTIAELDLAVRLRAKVIVLHDYALPDVADAVHGFLRRTGGELVVEPSEWGLAVIRL